MYWPNHEIEDHWYDKIPVKKILYGFLIVWFLLEVGYHCGYSIGYDDGYRQGHHDACISVGEIITDTFKDYLN